MPGVDPGPGRIPDSNSVLVAGLVREAGGVPVPLGAVGDDPAELRGVVAAALPGLDALVTSGGVSVGTKDVVKAALAEQLDFTAVAMQPGKPQGFGVLERWVPVFALPGNPVSVMVSFHVHVAPALRRMMGLPARVPLAAARAGVAWRCPPGRRQYLPVVLEDDGGALPSVRPASAGGSGSHLVASLALAEALAVVAEDVDAVAAGDEVGLLRWRRGTTRSCWPAAPAGGWAERSSRRSLCAGGGSWTTCWTRRRGAARRRRRAGGRPRASRSDADAG